MPENPVQQIHYMKEDPKSDSALQSPISPLLMVVHAFHTVLHGTLGNLACIAAMKGNWRVPGPLQSQQICGMGPRGVFVRKVFVVLPRKSQQINSSSGLCSLYSCGEQLGVGKFSH